MIAIDQYRQCVSLPGVHPRKELLDATGYGSAQRMYVDRPDGASQHVGYVVGGRWFTLSTVTPWVGTR